ncbi:hypothetical protein PVAP13_7NG295589 [Panicum virgatum]|uniref:Uncharacterized protein n=1 Tax=Panicum virgatum TaxID=38727 RepID=A0A8T0PWH4_PANVG|nr:hypothetical protein PVAP13_7NG295589 [Panicum virgatum]
MVLGTSSQHLAPRPSGQRLLVNDPPTPPPEERKEGEIANDEIQDQHDEPLADPTPEQILKQLQDELARAQQQRDALAATFAQNQRTMQISQQAAELCQQLAIIQAQIQSMTPTSLATSDQPPAAPPSGVPSIQTPPQPTSVTFVPSVAQAGGTFDGNLPLLEDLQRSAWPPPLP